LDAVGYAADRENSPMPDIRTLATSALLLVGLALGGAIFRLVITGEMIQAGSPAAGLPAFEACAPTLRCIALRPRTR
jgi:hypothetical protein